MWLRASMLGVLVTLLVLGVGAEMLSAQPKAAPIVELPAVLDLSGYTKDYAAIAKRTLEFAAEDINARRILGGRALHLKFIDDAADMAKSIQIFRSLGRDKNTIMMLGPFTTRTVIATHPLAGEAELTNLAAWSMGAWPGDYQNKYTFRMAIIDNENTISRTVDGIMKLHPEIKVVGDFIATDNPLDLSSAPHWKAAFERHGVKVVQTEFTTKTTDFSAQLNQIEAAHPQAIIQRGSTTFGIPLLKQAAQRGLKPLVLGTAVAYGNPGPWMSDKGLGNSLDGRVLYSSYWNPATSATADFIRAFKAKFGVEPCYYDALSWDALHIAAQAIHNAGGEPTRASVHKAMQSIHYSGVFGDYSWPSGCCDVTRGGELQILTYKNGSEVPAE